MNHEHVPRPHVGQPRPPQSYGHAPEDGHPQSRSRNEENPRVGPSGDRGTSGDRRDDAKASPDRDSSATKRER